MSASTVASSSADLACKLSGSNLFLVDSVSSDPKFTHPVQVPDGFPGYSMPVPHPTDGNLYVKLRDDPTVVNLTTFDAQTVPIWVTQQVSTRGQFLAKLSAASTLACIPVVLAGWIAQKRMIRGLAMGAIK